MTDSTTRELSPSQRADLARAVRAARWVGLILPLACVAVATVLQVIWLPRLPDPAATHWGFSGGPDGFGPAVSYIWLTAGLGGGLVLLLRGVIALGGLKPGMPIWSPYQRFMAAFTAGLGVFLSAVNLVCTAVQLDLQDAAHAPGIGGWMGAAFGLWVLVGFAAWFAQPAVDIRLDSRASTEPLELAETERAVWFGRIRPSKVFIWAMCAAILVLLATAVLVFTTPAGTAACIVIVASFVLVAACIAVSAAFTVRIDAAGLEARSILGWPVFRLPAEDVERVEVALIDPFTEFGGWGTRWAPGRFGIVMRAGEGLVATRKDGRIFAVTVDDAETAAAALATAVRGAQR